MLPRAILAFLALPGVVAYAVPLALGLTTAPRPLYLPVPAAALVCLGTGLLLWCVREFYVAGRGTLAPWAPPQHLVVSGPYRFSRNPMYVAVLTILAGWYALWGMRSHLIYAAGVLCAVQLRVLLAEEPWAARRFAAEWQAYRERVPRWFL